MAMQATLIQTAAMSVAETRHPTYLRIWMTALPPLPQLHVVHLCICHPLEFPFVMENRLDHDTPLKFDI